MTPTIKPTVKQDMAWQALLGGDAKYVVFGGGAGGGKSWIGCEWEMTNCYKYPGYKGFIAREELSRLKKSTYVTFIKVCQHHKIPRDDWKYNGQDNYIEFVNGSRIDLLDIAWKPSDPLYERFGSLEYSNGWIEEAGETKFLAFDVLKSRIGRHLNKEMNIPIKMFITCNPKKNWLYKDVYRPWKENRLSPEFIFIQSLYQDNPHTATEYGEQLRSIKDKATKQRLMYGNWEYDDDPTTLMNFDSITDLFSNTAETGDRYITADVARHGSDKTIIMLWNKWKVEKIIVKAKQGVDKTVIDIRTLAKEHNVPYSNIIADEDGVGGGVIDFMQGINGFVNNSAPLINPASGEKQNYSNLKAQCYYMLADRVNNHGMSIECTDESVRELIIEDLEQVKSKDLDKGGKLQIIGKDEIKELIGRSPDFSDALMMRMWFELEQIGGDEEEDEDFNMYASSYD